MNETAAFIWEHASESQLEVQFAERYQLSLSEAAQEVHQTLKYWQEQKSILQTKPKKHAPVIPEAPVVTQLYKIAQTVIEIRFHSAGLADEILPRLTALQTSVGPACHTIDLVEHDGASSVFVDGGWLGDEPLITGTRIIVLQEMARLAVPNREFEAILHAGVVGDLEKCIILAGQSFSGKSTLSAALMQAGLVCYSDDSAALTQDYLVAGLPFAISLREGSWFLFPHVERPRFLPSNLKDASPEATPVAMVFVSYDPHASFTVLSKVDTFQALLELQQSGFWVNRTQASIAKFIDWLGALPVYRLTYAELPAAISEVRRLLDT